MKVLSKLSILLAGLELCLIRSAVDAAHLNKTTTFRVNGGGTSPIYFIPSSPVTLFQESPRDNASYKASFSRLVNATLDVVDKWIANNKFALFNTMMDDTYNLTITLSSDLESKLASRGGCFEFSREFLSMYFTTVFFHMGKYNTFHSSDTCDVLNLHFAPKSSSES